jgi:hypothetical protein
MVVQAGNPTRSAVFERDVRPGGSFPQSMMPFATFAALSPPSAASLATLRNHDRRGLLRLIGLPPFFYWSDRRYARSASIIAI